MGSSSSSSPISSSVRADLLKMFFKLLLMISSFAALGIPAKFPISWTDQVPVPLCIAAAGALVSGFVFLICFRDHGEEEEQEEYSEKSRKSSASAENVESSATTQKAEEEQMMMFEEKIYSPSLVEMREKKEKPLSYFASPPEVKQTMSYSPDMGSSVTEADKPKVAPKSRRKSMPSIVFSDEASLTKLLKMFFKLLLMISSFAALGIPAKFPISWTDQVPVPLCIAAAGALVSGFVFLVCFRDHGEEEEQEEYSEKSRKSSASAENVESSATTQKAEEEQMMMFEEKIHSPSLVEMREKKEEPLSYFASPPEVKQTMSYSPDMGSSVTEADKPKVAPKSRRKSMPSIVFSDEASLTKLLKMFFKLLLMISSFAALGIPAKFPISWTDQVPVPLCIAAAGALVSGFVFLVCFRDHGEEEEQEEYSEKSRKSSASAENVESSATTQKAEEEQMMMFEEKIHSPSLVEMREKKEEPLSYFASPPEVKQTMSYSPDMGSSVTEADKPKVAPRSRRKSMPSIVFSDEASINSSTNSTEGKSLRRSSRIRNRMMMSPPSNRRMVAAM